MLVTFYNIQLELHQRIERDSELHVTDSLSVFWSSLFALFFCYYVLLI